MADTSGAPKAEHTSGRCPDTPVVEDDDIGPLESEEEEHLGGPPANAPYLHQVLSHLVVVESIERVKIEFSREYGLSDPVEVLALATGNPHKTHGVI